MNKLISIIVVCLNPGSKLEATLNSIKGQTYDDYEVIVKDGVSNDGTVEYLTSYKDMDITFVSKEDKGIYDAMNSALSYAKGDFVYFLNCGDLLNDENVLKNVAMAAQELKDKDAVIYGNIYERRTNSLVMSNPQIDGFACYRNVPCHQSCFYKREFIMKHPFDTSFKVRADYEQFLWTYYRAKTTYKYVNLTIASYEGNGYSESAIGKKISDDEHKLITRKYMSAKEIFKYKACLMLSLAPIRRRIAQSPVFAGAYNKLKKAVYSKK